MTKERLNEIKTFITERADYYAALNFNNLANEYLMLKNFVIEVEALIAEQEALKEKIRAFENQLDARMKEATEINDYEVYSL